MYSPFTKIMYIPLCLFGTPSQSYLICCLLGDSPLFAPPKTFNFHVVHFWKSAPWIIFSCIPHPIISQLHCSEIHMRIKPGHGMWEEVLLPCIVLAFGNIPREPPDFIPLLESVVIQVPHSIWSHMSWWWKKPLNKRYLFPRIIHSFQLFSHVRLFATPWTAAPLASLGPSPTPTACSNSCPSSQWCHTTISSSVTPFSSCLQSFPASGSLPVSQFFTLGGQITGFSAWVSVLPMNIQDWFPLGWTGLILVQSKGIAKVISNTTVQKHQCINSSALSFLYSPNLTSAHDY